MAVFLVNQCTFTKQTPTTLSGADSNLNSNNDSDNTNNNNTNVDPNVPPGQCGLRFASLFELIHHIEDNHIEPATNVTPSCLPISCVLRIFATSGNSTANSHKMLPTTNGNSTVNSHKMLPTTNGNSTANSHKMLPTTNGTITIDQPMVYANQIAPNVTTTIDQPIVYANQIAPNGTATIDQPMVHANTIATNGTTPIDQPMVYANQIVPNDSEISVGPTKTVISTLQGNNKTIMSGTLMGNNHQAKTYKCECGRIYKTPHGLRSHMNVHHPQSAQTAMKQVATQPKPPNQQPQTTTTTISATTVVQTSVTQPSKPQVTPQITVKTTKMTQLNKATPGLTPKAPKQQAPKPKTVKKVVTKQNQSAPVTPSFTQSTITSQFNMEKPTTLFVGQQQQQQPQQQQIQPQLQPQQPPQQGFINPQTSFSSNRTNVYSNQQNSYQTNQGSVGNFATQQTSTNNQLQANYPQATQNPQMYSSNLIQSNQQQQAADSTGQTTAGSQTWTNASAFNQTEWQEEKKIQ